MSVYDKDDQHSVYYIDADKGFILDTGSNDVRTEGMSYGMMISVQLDRPDEFDRLWRWSKEHMAYGPSLSLIQLIRKTGFWRRNMERLWNTEPPTGKYRYYDGMVYFLSMLHASGNFSL